MVPSVAAYAASTPACRAAGRGRDREEHAMRGRRGGLRAGQVGRETGRRLAGAAPSSHDQAGPRQVGGSPAKALTSPVATSNTITCPALIRSPEGLVRMSVSLNIS